MELSSLLDAMVKMALLMALGFVLRRCHQLSETGVRELSSLAVNITCPLLVIASVERMESADYGIVLSFFGVGAAIYLLLPFFAYLAARILQVKKEERHTYEFMLLFCNTSLLGFPIVQSLFGDEAVFYTAILHIPFDILVYSYGFYLMGGGDNFHGRNLWNPGFVLTLLALAAYVFQIKTPAILTDTCYLIGNITTPVAMLVMGASLAEVRLLSIFTEKRLYGMAALRLLGIPLVIHFLLVHLTHFGPELVAIATITFGMPVGSMIVMLAQQFRHQVALSVQAVSLTTIGCLFTIPLLLQFLVTA